jgi:hypothetical protein
VKDKNGSSETAVIDEVAGLREMVGELTARLHALEGDIDGANGANGNGKASRRDLLRLAGALAAGAAGGLVLRPIGAAAASGGNMVLGQANDANAPTTLAPTAASTPSSLFEVIGQNPPTIPANPSTHSTNATPPVTSSVTVPVVLAVAPFGVFPTNGATPPVTVYPGVAPIQGIGGAADLTQGSVTFHVSEGVDGWAPVDNTDVNAFGGGVVGQSDFGIGVVGAGGTDIAAFGTGYLAQASITDNTGTRVAGPPPAPVYNFEQARDKDGILWLSNPLGAWRRVNTVIPMAPFRKYDSRPAARGPNSVTTIQIAGLNGIPTDAVGVFGNLTALGPSADGFLTMYPTGQAVPGVNSLNYSRGVTAISNHVVCALGAGQVSIYVSGNGSTNIIFDVQGYIQ